MWPLVADLRLVSEVLDSEDDEESGDDEEEEDEEDAEELGVDCSCKLAFALELEPVCEGDAFGELLGGTS